MTEVNYAQHYLAMGRMIVMFQSLEATLKSELTLLMNNELGTPAGQLIYAMVAELSFGTASRIASALPGIFTIERFATSSAESKRQLAESLSETSTQLKDGLKLAGEVEARRNQLVHSHWFIGPGYVPPLGVMARMKTKTKKGAVSIAFENESLADIDAITERAKQAQQLLGGALRDYKHIAQYQW